MTPDDRLLDANEVAEFLHVPVSWVREHTRSGHLPHAEIGRYCRYDREDALVWVQAQKKGGAAWRKYVPTT